MNGSAKFVGTFYVTVDLSVPVIIVMDLLRQQKCKIEYIIIFFGAVKVLYDVLI